MEKKNKIKIFEEQKVRTVWDAEQEKWYFSIIDVIEILTGTDRPRKYWSDLKAKLKKEGSQLSAKIGQLKLKLPTTKTELLFVERIFNMLKMGGPAAVIVPSGVIQNSGKAFEALRKLIIEKAELKAVIALSGGVFKPYAGVSTAILIFTKGGETNHVWFYDMKADGYTLDDKRNKIAVLPDGKAGSDLPDIVQRYKNRLNHDSHDSGIPMIKNNKENEIAESENLVKQENPKNQGSDRRLKYFIVPKKEIVENKYDLNLSTYKEEVYEEVVYEKPEVIFGKLETIEKNIETGMKELKILINK